MAKKRKSSSKQREQRTKFKVAVKYCKGQADYRACMKRQLRK